MKTKFKHIAFAKVGDVWIARNHKQDFIIGVVEYMARWKKWEFVPGPDTGYTSDCCRDIAAFLDTLLEEKP